MDSNPGPLVSEATALSTVTNHCPCIARKFLLALMTFGNIDLMHIIQIIITKFTKNYLQLTHLTCSGQSTIQCNKGSTKMKSKI